MSQSTRRCFQGARRPRIGVQAIRLPARRQHGVSERQRILPAPSRAALDRRNLLQRTVSAPSAVQQEAAPTAVSTTVTPADDDFLINQGQLCQLAQTKDSPLFEGASVANVFQLANALRTSLEFGLVTDATDLQIRATVFGSNTLPSKEEVSLTSSGYVGAEVMRLFLFSESCTQTQAFCSCRLLLQSWSKGHCQISQFSSCWAPALSLPSLGSPWIPAMPAGLKALPYWWL